MSARSKFVLMRRAPKTKTWADWRTLELHIDFCKAVDAREHYRKIDAKYGEAGKWEYKIEDVTAIR